jgi:hypothetical protein
MCIFSFNVTKKAPGVGGGIHTKGGGMEVEKNVNKTITNSCVRIQCRNNYEYYLPMFRQPYLANGQY